MHSLLHQSLAWFCAEDEFHALNWRNVLPLRLVRPRCDYSANIFQSCAYVHALKGLTLLRPSHLREIALAAHVICVPRLRRQCQSFSNHDIVAETEIGTIINPDLFRRDPATFSDLYIVFEHMDMDLNKLGRDTKQAIGLDHVRWFMYEVSDDTCGLFDDDTCDLFESS